MFISTSYTHYRSQIMISHAGKLGSLGDSRDTQLELLTSTEGKFKFSSLPNKLHFIPCSARGKGLEESCVAQIAAVKQWIEQFQN